MKLISWNVNGLRALHRGGYWEWFEKTKPDILGLQEIKAEEQQLPPEVQNPEGYHAFFNSSRERKGYSGVALYSREKPKQVQYDVLPDKFNTEGRLIQAKFEKFTILNVYFPNGGRGKDRLEFKLDYYDAFLEHIEKLRKGGESVIFCGDLNVAHEEVDLARPRENQKTSGFLPEERAWFDELVNLGYLDTFRHLHSDAKEMYSYWDQITRARDRNVGWRIDYFLASSDLESSVKSADILTDVYGSDHCPVSLDLEL